MSGTSSPSTDGSPEWLPDAIPFTGDWHAFVAGLYAIFTRDFKGQWPRFRACPVWHDRRLLPDGDGKEEGFWHLITRDQSVWNTKLRRNEKERLPELARAEKLPWARPIIDHESDPAVQVWDFDEATQRGLKVRTYVWLKDWDFVVILERQAKEKGDVFLLITSFQLDHEGKRRDMESRYDRRKK